MSRKLCLAVFAVVLMTVVMPLAHAAEPVFTDQFLMDKSDLMSTGSNPYFSLVPGFQQFYKGPDGDLTITVLNETKVVDGVKTRIIEERENEGGKLIEVSRNYYAISKKNNSVFYFGEDVDMYDKNGKITDHGGTWYAGVNGARAGLMMPGVALVGARHYQEVAPKVAMDRAEILSVTETMTTPAGTFHNVVKTAETTPVESGTEYKFYAPGAGLLKDGDLLLVRYGVPGKAKGGEAGEADEKGETE
jgi:hypothetical protein